MDWRPADWVSAIPLWWIGVFALLTLVGSLLVIPVLVVWMPADYFVRRDPRPESWWNRHPAVHATERIARNCLGLVLVAAGAIMLFTPGQGVLTLVLGLTLLDLPGKRRLEHRLVASPPVRRTLDAMRRAAGRPPIQFPPA